MNIETKVKETYEALKGSFPWANRMQIPKLEKIVISTGTGRARKDKQKTDLIQDRLAKISGQKPIARKAKKSIASFKLREGEDVGYSVTLRGKNMINFLDKFINVAIPRMRDFRGIPRKSIDEIGNLTIGIPEHTVFPETPDENIQDVFGISVTIVLTTNDKAEAEAFYEYLGMPFVKKES